MAFEIALLTNLVTLGIAVIIQFVTISQQHNILNNQTKQVEEERKERIREAELSRVEVRRAEWKAYLIKLMEILLDARMEYERFMGTDKNDTERHAGIVGKAIAACLAANDEMLTSYATHHPTDDLTPYFKEKVLPDGTVKDWASRNRDTMQLAVQRLAELIRAT